MIFFGSRRFKIFLHIFFGLLLGGSIGLVYLSSSVTFRQYLQHRVQHQFERDYGYQMQCNLDKIDWLSCSMSFSGVQITPLQPDDGEPAWSISVEQLELQGSWLSLLMGGYLKVSLSLQHMIMLETFDQAPRGLPEFCSKMFGQPMSSSVVYDLISITDGLIYLKRSFDGLNIQIPYSCNMRAELASTRMQIYVHDGSIGYENKAWMQGIEGSMIYDLPYVDFASKICGQVQMHYQFVRSEQKIPGFLAGKIEHGVGDFVLKTEDGSVVIDPIKINCSKDACWCNLMVDATSQVLNYFEIPAQMVDVAGSVGLELACDLYRPLETLQASIVFNDITYKSKSILPGGKLVITDHHKQGFSGMFAVHDQNMFAVSVLVDAQQKHIKAHNVVDLQIPFNSSYKILQQGCQFHMIYDQSGKISGSYEIELCHQLLDQRHKITGKFELIEGKLHFFGTVDGANYEGSMKLFPEYVFEFFQLKRGDDLLIDISTDAQDSLYVVGSVDFSVLQVLVPVPFKISFAQEGSFVFRGYLKDGMCQATVQTHYAHIRVPYVYNVIQNISATAQLDLHEKKLIFKDVDVQWYEGKLSCSHAQLYFDKNFVWSFVHAPLMLHDVMLSWNKGVYGLVSGRILLSKSNLQEPLHIAGQLMVQKAELKENIFSAEFQEIFTGIAYGVKDEQTTQPYIDISLFTKDPLQIKTSFLTAKAVVDVRVQGLLSKTELSGSIRLISGMLLFPYKPLEIVDGRLLFMPEQPFDPVIELEAKGKIKRFHVGLKAWGCAADPHIQFEAQPYLSEDQIVSLLLLGVQDQSISMVVPAFLTQRLKDIMFGPALSNIKLKSVFDRLLQSLKYVRFIPQFTSQSGKGGMRGIFEIDASENLQGKIDTNFTDLEDTKFDVDYAVTDDVTLRLQKDGPSAYGGQVEFCWKFS